MTTVVQDAIQQTKPFGSLEEEVYLAILIAADRIGAPFTQFLKSQADLTVSQYNVLRILRGARPGKLTCGQIGARLVARDPDVTRLIDRLTRRGFIRRSRNARDRRVVDVAITDKGMDALSRLDESVARMPKAVIGHLGQQRLRQLKADLSLLISQVGTFP